MVMSATSTIKIDNIPEIIVLLPILVDQAVLHSADEVQAEWRDRMFDAPRGGQVYFIGGRIHVASAPGEVPAVLSGDYTDSIYTSRLGDSNYAITAGVDYAVDLEFGTLDLAPRPVAGPVANAYMDRFIVNIEHAVSEAVES